MTNAPDQATLPPIKGSWEARLHEAQQLAGNFNDDALPLFEKLYTRLGKLPKPKRMAAEGRLQNIYLQTAFDYQTYLTVRGRCDEAVAVLDHMITEASEDERDALLMHSTFVLLQGGRIDEAVERTRTRAEANDDDRLTVWGDLALLYTRIGRIDDAEAVADNIDQIIAKDREDGADEDEEMRADQAYVGMLRTVLAMDRGLWDDAITRFDETVALNPAYADQSSILFTRMVREGQPALALQLMAREKNPSPQIIFWRGLAHQRLGEREKALADWRKVAAVDPAKHETPFIFELIMAHYYLGDEDGSGLATALRLLQEREENPWGLFVLAGLGWALRNNMSNAHSNLELAMMLRRAQSTGSYRLPPEIWMFLEDLLSETQQAELSRYFGEKRAIAGQA